MPDKLLICTDLDRTLIPNGPQPESPDARNYFSSLVERHEVILAYVSGRHRKLVQKAINNYFLPMPDFVIGDVGTTIYHVGKDNEWERQAGWEERIAADWNGRTHSDLKAMLNDIHALRPQESAKQNHFKLSYYVPIQSNREAITALIKQRFKDVDVKASLIWSVDEPAGIGLLDILPAGASKYHAIEVLASPIPAVLVANSQPDVKELATLLAKENNCTNELYIAKGGFLGMNGNYSAGMLEGIAHYYPWTKEWMRLKESEDKS